MILLSVTPDYKPGDPAPKGYCQKQEWADVQIKGGLRQTRCSVCKLFKFPQERCDCSKEEK